MLRSIFRPLAPVIRRCMSDDVTQTIKVTVPREMAQRGGSLSAADVMAEPVQVIPRPQDRAPNFKAQAVVNRSFKELSLQDFKGKWVVLFFYPLDFTFVCPTEIIAFSDAVSQFEGMNTQLLACSTDSHFSHLAWINMPRKEGGLGEMNIPLIADYNKRIAVSYGVLLGDLGAALRGLFIIDPKGVIRHTCVNDLPVGRSVEETLRLVQAFQFSDEHGQVCPANWTPEKTTIKPTPDGSKEFFSKTYTK